MAAFVRERAGINASLGRFPWDRLNPNGGSIAIGHPFGATGARMLTTLVHAMRRRQVRYGMATMCIGVGQGMAMVIEKV